MIEPPRVGLLRGTLLLAGKELRAEARGWVAVQGVALFAVLAVLMFSFSLGPDGETLRRLAPGLLWLAVTLASLLSAGRSFAVEHEAETLESLLAHPVPRESLFLGKALAGFVLLGAVALGALALEIVLYGLPAPRAGVALLGGLVAAPLGLALTGTFYGAVSASAPAREALLPMLLLPVLVPLVIASTQVTAAGFAGDDALGWLALLAAFDGILLALALALFPFLLEQ